MMRRFPALLTAPVVLVTAFLLLGAAPTQRRARKKKAVTAPYGNANAISVKELKDYDYFIASDQTEGRWTPSRGYDVTALYIASQVSEWGLEPGGSTSGTNGPLQPYFQPIDMISTNPDPAHMRLSVSIPAPPPGTPIRFFYNPARLRPGVHSMPYGHDWIVDTPSNRGFVPLVGGSFQDAPLVFAGNGYLVGNQDPYQGLDVQGKVIVVAGAAPAAAVAYERKLRPRFWSGELPKVQSAGPQVLTPAEYAAAHGALAIIHLPSLNQLMEMSAPGAGKLHFGPNGPWFTIAKFWPDAGKGVPELVAGPALINALFQGEKVSAAAAMGGGTLPSFAFAAGKTISGNVAITTTHNHTENIIAMLPGSDPALRDQYVVISAHVDHIGMSATPNCTEGNPVLAAGDSTDFGLTMAPDQKDCDGINNGADDDGSGATALLGIAHAYATGAAKGIRPKRTMVFAWFAGEEKGLWGSQYFVEFPPIDIHKVTVDLNMDMVGRSRTPGYVDPPHYRLSAPGEVFVMGPEVISSSLGQTMDAVNDAFQKMKFNHFYDDLVPDATHDNIGPGNRGEGLYYRSDQLNFERLGIPGVFFNTGLHVDYHRVSDSPDKVDFTKVQQIAKTIAAIAWKIGTEPNSALPHLNAQLPQQFLNVMAAAKDAGWGQLTPVQPPLPGEPF
ncbi:MAG: M28 family peptidase [Terriglobales bacterium]